jgi:hypothetical protein
VYFRWLNFNFPRLCCLHFHLAISLSLVGAHCLVNRWRARDGENKKEMSKPFGRLLNSNHHCAGFSMRSRGSASTLQKGVLLLKVIWRWRDHNRSTSQRHRHLRRSAPDHPLRDHRRHCHHCCRCCCCCCCCCCFRGAVHSYFPVERIG